MSTLGLFRTIVHAAFHLSDLTYRLERLYQLKPGATDEILSTLAQMSKCIRELESTECQRELAQARLSEVPQGRKRDA